MQIVFDDFGMTAVDTGDCINLMRANGEYLRSVTYNCTRGRKLAIAAILEYVVKQLKG